MKNISFFCVIPKKEKQKMDGKSRTFAKRVAKGSYMQVKTDIKDGSTRQKNVRIQCQRQKNFCERWGNRADYLQ